MKKITKTFLQKLCACNSAMRIAEQENWFGLPADELINKAIAYGRFDWANWLIVRLMNRKQKVQYAIFAAELVIDIYEKKYPDNDKPKKAIEAAKAYLKNPSKKTKSDASNAANAAAYAAANVAADAAANVAAYAANVAANVAAYAANAAANVTAYAAANVAADAANVAADAANAAANVAAIKKQIITYGLTLIK